MMHPTQVNSLKRKTKDLLRNFMPSKLRDSILTFLTSYNSVWFVNLLLKSFTCDLLCSRRDFGWLKLFAFSSYPNSWELADSARLLLPISHFPKFVYFMPQLSLSSRISEFGLCPPSHILYDFTLCDFILLYICVFLDWRVNS